MQTKLGISMTLPQGKLPGFYAQIVKALAGKTQLFDRDKEMLVVNGPEDRETVMDIMRQYKVETEELELLLLPEDAETTALFDDYGFTSRQDNRYLFRSLVKCFRLTAANPDAEPKQALEQIAEYIIASSEDRGSGSRVYAVDGQHDELMIRIAKAYKCTAEFQ